AAGGAEGDGAEDLREWPAVARRDLRYQSVTRLHDPAVRRRHRWITRPGAEQEEVVLGTERPGVALELDRKLVLAHAGARDLEHTGIAQLGDAGRLARVGDLVICLRGGSVEHDIVGGARLRQRLLDAVANLQTRK